MLKVFLTTHRIRRATHRISKITSTCAVLFGLSILSLAHASVFCPGGTCGGINGGVTTAAVSIPGVTTNTPATTIVNIILVAVSYVNLLAFAMIIIAGFYLILGLGNDNARGTAKNIILYTGIGLIIINLSVAIRDFLGGIATGSSAFGGSTGLNVVVNAIINVFTSYVGLLAVAVIIIAGFYLILGLGNDSSKETAKKIVLYTAIGIVLILLANVIVAFFQGLPTGTNTSGIYDVILTILKTVLSFVGLIAVVVIVIAGIMLLVSGGEEGRKDTAKKIIMYAIIGLIVIILASAIVRFIASLV
jgi:cytochrome bd-type quinol oxidase subunit 2